MEHEEILEYIANVEKKVDLLLQESRAYFKLGSGAIEEVYEMSATLEGMARTYTQLERMPSIFSEIGSKLDNLYDLGMGVRTDLVKPATGSDRIDTKSVHMLMAFSIFVILLLGIVIIVDRVVDTAVSVSGKTPVGSFSVQGSLPPAEDPTPKKEGLEWHHKEIRRPVRQISF